MAMPQESDFDYSLDPYPDFDRYVPVFIFYL